MTWWTIREVLFQVDAASSADVPELLSAIRAALQPALVRLGLALLVMGLIDFAFQVRKINTRLRMSPDERREEQRASDGDPGRPARQRSAQVRNRPGIETQGPTSAEAI